MAVPAAVPTLEDRPVVASLESGEQRSELRPDDERARQPGESAVGVEVSPHVMPGVEPAIAKKAIPTDCYHQHDTEIDGSGSKSVDR